MGARERGEKEEREVEEEATEQEEEEDEVDDEEERVGEKENADSSEEERKGGERTEGEGGGIETGILNEKVDPWPIVLFTSMFPPIASTNCLQIASPKMKKVYISLNERGK